MAIHHNQLPLTARQNARVDDLQEQLMARDSAEGRPPSHRWRLAGWKWLLLLAPLFVTVVLAIAITNGVGFATLMVGVVICSGYLLLAIWPVWRAGLLRGTEERTARSDAVVEIRNRDKPESSAP